VPYGVVACPSCRRAKVFELGTRTTACPLCGRRLDTSRLVTETAGTVEQAQTLVGAVNARLAAATPAELASMTPPDDAPAPASDALVAVVRATRSANGETARADAAARALSAALGTFTAPQWTEAVANALGEAAATKAETHLRRMLAANVLFEPRPGVYRAL